jgi:membrane protein insertase Oxa1/YidC/SpoIIIJ
MPIADSRASERRTENQLLYLAKSKSLLTFSPFFFFFFFFFFFLAGLGLELGASHLLGR